MKAEKLKRVLEDLMTEAEAAAFLGVETSTLRASRSSGRLAGYRAPMWLVLGSQLRYSKEMLEVWSKNRDHDTRGRRRAKSAAEAIREAKMARMEQLRQTV